MVKVRHVTIGPTMNFILQPWQLLFMSLAGWVNREQQETIDYLQTETQVLREKLGKKHILLNDNQRPRQGRQTAEERRAGEGGEGTQGRARRRCLLCTGS